MTTQQYLCKNPRRIAALRAAALETPPRWFNGIEYLEVMHGEPRLVLHFVHDLSQAPAVPLAAANVEVRGGQRVRDPRVLNVAASGRTLQVELDGTGDFSRYTLRLVASAGSDAPPDGIDPALAQIAFGFKVDCPSDFDCRAAGSCAPEIPHVPDIDYLARDYQSFRRLVLDRLSVLMPGWRERNPADLLVTLSEALAYRADEIAYFQDAVATEAYLGTARQRVSVKRHARLLDYAVHEGCNARAWVAFEVDATADGRQLAACDAATGLDGTLLLTQAAGAGRRLQSRAQARDLVRSGAQPFELLTPLTLYSAHSDLRFYTWSDEACCLPRGATRAFLRDDTAHRLRLRAGDLLLLEARAGTTNGLAQDADPLQRHVVRLTRVDPEAGADRTPAPTPRRDPVTGQPLVEVQWAAGDALPFDLCLSKVIGGTLVQDMAGACANIALADHGMSPEHSQPLLPVPGCRVPRMRPADGSLLPATRQGLVRDALGQLTLADAATPATAALGHAPADTREAMQVTSDGDGRAWSARRDLLGSDAQAADFVVETGDGGGVLLRFGDGVNGRRPGALERLSLRMREGNGSAGNVGAGTIAHVLCGFDGITRVRNPLAASGGAAPLALARARMDAPQAFRRQERAVTPEDYAAVAMRDPRVQRAVATRRWTGSWHTMFVTVDRRGGEGVDPAFEDSINAFIDRFRLAGHDVEIDAPAYVALDIALHVCARPGYFAADVEQRLLQRFGTAPGGFFDPDRYSFGEPVYLSAVVAAAMAVPGVAFVKPLRFRRLGHADAGEIDAGRITMARLEIARLDNDPNAPQNGKIAFQVHAMGGTP
ncbi:putative baseplate assembly protein [Alicycliphilus denitrificans]|uniref:putative baseplate assembly protein n=1 Tax=Alicycliphilus denitrificans TaxID=179636 RepID=UPI0019158F0F|nr:putative baseplate assembly protein [Alicycliphilus denitrificans]MBN9572421.1 putative baseplate assembly protein [Alicycliphilus denitrificans]BCN37817.1 putative baseplate assembly protein [Alicycliphilus denitrificans]